MHLPSGPTNQSLFNLKATPLQPGNATSSISLRSRAVPILFPAESPSLSLSLSPSDHSRPSDHSPSTSAAMALSADDVQTMYSLLLNSLSSEVSIRKPAEDALSQCENRPGFCSCLLVIHSLSIPLQFCSHF